jgi:hypothetical protein
MIGLGWSVLIYGGEVDLPEVVVIDLYPSDIVSLVVVFVNQSLECVPSGVLECVPSW